MGRTPVEIVQSLLVGRTESSSMNSGRPTLRMFRLTTKISKVKKGGTFASVLAPPSNAAAHPDVRIETMVVKSAPATLVHMAEAIRAGKLVIPLGQRFALADANKGHLAAERGAVGKLLLLAG